jgi:multicomponent Na+:H+ antiporter subunit A
MLIGFIGLGEVAGSYSISEIIEQRDILISNSSYTWIAAFILIGAVTKSAQFPFHFWLPGAMKAPTPVSAYLHSATMVKAGIYLIARLTPALGDMPFWNNTLLILGGVTMVYAAFQALFHKDMKSILAYSTVSALGILVFLLGIGTKASFLAASVFILVHGLYKASLFMVTGIVDHETKSRDVSHLRGLKKVLMPVAIAGLLAAISNAGIPPSLGFIGKDLVYEATEMKGILFTVLAVITKVFLLAAGFLAGWKPFAGQLPIEYNNVHLPEKAMWIPPLFLAILGIVFGLFPQLIEQSVVGPVFQSISGDVFTGHLALWHGLNTVLLLSGITIALGFVLFVIIKPGATLSNFIQKSERFGPKKLLTGIADSFILFAKVVTQFFQNGYLRYYIIFIMVTLIGLLGFEMWHYTSFETNNRLTTEVTLYEGITVFILIVSVIITVFSQSRLASVAALGVMGLAICIVFVFYSAPDLAMTQFTIDTLTVILFVLVLYKLPKFIPLRFTFHHLRDGVIAIGFGTLISFLTLEVLTKSVNREISEYYAANSYLLAKGKNVVNVILVDFRGADTIVEIAVLSIAAIGVFSLLKLRLPKRERIE